MVISEHNLKLHNLQLEENYSKIFCFTENVKNHSKQITCKLNSYMREKKLVM